MGNAFNCPDLGSKHKIEHSILNKNILTRNWSLVHNPQKDNVGRQTRVVRLFCFKGGKERNAVGGWGPHRDVLRAEKTECGKVI